MSARLVPVESYLTSASGDPGGGGDAIVLCPAYSAVIDGATSKTRLTFGGLSSDRFAAREVGEAVRSLPPGLTATDAIERLNLHLSGAVSDLGFDNELVHMPSARLAIVSHERDELWQVGDVAAVLDGRTVAGQSPPSDALLTGVRSFFMQAALRSGATEEELMAHDPSVPLLRPLREVQRLFSNDPDSIWGFASVDGSTTPEEFISVTSISGVEEVVLATNGFARVHTTLARTLEEHERLMAADPLRVSENRQLRRGSTAGWDDMAYLRLVRA